MADGTSELLDEFRQGSLDAFEALFRLHQRLVHGWILRIVRNPATAEELTVETFWRIHRAHARFDPLKGFEPWVRRIATRVALDWLRATRHDAALPEATAELAAPAVADAAVTAEIRTRAAQAFGRLPPRLRIAATLAVVEGQPHKEVAEALGISVTAVKQRVFRALRLLRNDLERQGIRP